jgi:hypothetical protein
MSFSRRVLSHKDTIKTGRNQGPGRGMTETFCFSNSSQSSALPGKILYCDHPVTEKSCMQGHLWIISVTMLQPRKKTGLSLAAMLQTDD